MKRYLHNWSKSKYIPIKLVAFKEMYMVPIKEANQYIHRVTYRRIIYFNWIEFKPTIFRSSKWSSRVLSINGILW